MTPQPLPEHGFEIVERLVREVAQQGSSPTLERWLARAREQLASRTESGGMRERRAAAKIGEAFELAGELVTGLAGSRRHVR